MVSALWGLSSEDGEAAAREAAVKAKLRLWNETAFCVTLLELLAVTGWIILRGLLMQCCRRWAYSVETMRKLAYMCFSTFVCLSQFTLLVALPMSTFLGSELSPPHAAEPCSNAMMLLSGQNSALKDPEATLMSCGFTAVYVSYIGLNLVFFFLALPPGIFMGIMMFFTVMWTERRTRYMADLATLCLLVTELVSFASILGPFVITYQILGGSLEWWLACGVVGVFRPLFAVPACLLMNRFAEPGRPVFLIASVSLAYLGLSFTGAVIFWKSFNVALEALSDAAQQTAWGGDLSGYFACTMYCTVVWFLASSTFLALEDVTCNGSRHIRSLRSWVQGKSGILIAAACKKLDGYAYEAAEAAKHNMQHLPTQASATSWQAIWKAALPWIIFVLEMDALVSLLYHAVKIGWLGRDFWR